MDVAIATLRPMTLDDVDAVARLEERAFTEPWSEAAFRDELSHDDRRYVVAESGGRVVGYGGILLIGEEAHVMTIAVDPPEARRGIGTRLMVALVEAAVGGGARHLTLEVRPSNAAALGLYRRFGFASVGVRPGYYRDEDAVVMWAIDIDGPEARRRLDRIREDVA